MIVLPGAKLFRPEDRLALAGFWNDRAGKLENQQRDMAKPSRAGAIFDDIRTIDHIGDIITIIADTLQHPTIDELIEAEFPPPR